MAIFGKSDEELKQFAAELEKRQIKLDSEASENKRQQAALEHALENVKGDRDALEQERKAFSRQSADDKEQLATERAGLEKRRQELGKLEAEAKAGFAEAQREAFAEIFEKRQTDLDAIKKHLDSLTADISKRLETLHSQEGDLAKRELAVTEREQKADAGFADKVKALEVEASRQHKANQDEAERLRKLADDLAAQHKDLEDRKASLVQREHRIIEAEQERDAGFADARTALQSEMTASRAEKLAAMEKEVAELRAKRLEEVTVAENSERARIGAEIAKERETWAREQDEARKLLESERTELEKQRGAVSALQSELEGRRVELEASERTLERKEQRLEQQWQQRNDKIEDVIEDRIAERRKSMESAEQSHLRLISDLRESLRIQTELVGAFEQLSRQLGGRAPAEVIREINSMSDEIARLQNELATRPTEEMRERNQALETDAKNQKARADELARQIAECAADVAEVTDLRRKNSELNAENKSLAQKASIFEGAANEAEAELTRLRAAYESPAEVTARYKEIEMPHFKTDKVKRPEKAEIDEMQWLEGVEKKCKAYGLHFNPRILNAFHTALKTAEWSPLTVLAGVSGTGKSELPRLYSHFGGIFFEPISVQPNWDSQESMLGYFNSIDNCFVAQPVLRFLAQSQKKWIGETNDGKSYPGLEDAVCLVLLDEMNLAHPELYFAEFLSKLELRRGMRGANVPTLPVRVGAKMLDYQLPLGRNVLWTGTMNQDETTKSLSDKVLDRSIIIHFPRPTELKSRQKLNALDETPFVPLHRKIWESWWVKEVHFSTEEIAPYRQFLESVNSALADAGKAIGHRVWQSVEYYMANYPDVRTAQLTGNKDALEKALHVAFEDQLVQKVMPKLRGIDTPDRSVGGKCLAKIRAQITNGIGGNAFNLTEDFDLACKLGYGQFIWQSANYLKEDQAPTDSASMDSEEPVENPNDNVPK